MTPDHELVCYMRGSMQALYYAIGLQAQPIA